jgi:long-subunit acyl-CoA synthetase (AMP-forming)
VSHPSWFCFSLQRALISADACAPTDKYKASEDWNKYLAGSQVKLIELLDVMKSVCRHRVVCCLVVMITFSPRPMDSLVQGQTGRQQHVAPKPDDLASILYTSGTTGEPKVRLFHFSRS